MDEFLIQNFFGIICCVAAFGITYILRTISNSITELQKDYKALIANNNENRQKMQENIHSIQVLIAGEYVKRSEISQLVSMELRKVK